MRMRLVFCAMGVAFVAIFRPQGEAPMDRICAAVAAVAAFGLAACASGPTKEEDLVNRAVEAMGGASRLAEIQSVSARGTSRQWEPEQSDVPGGEFRFAND